MKTSIKASVKLAPGEGFRESMTVTGEDLRVEVAGHVFEFHQNVKGNWFVCADGNQLWAELSAAVEALKDTSTTLPFKSEDSSAKSKNSFFWDEDSPFGDEDSSARGEVVAPNTEGLWETDDRQETVVLSAPFPELHDNRAITIYENRHNLPKDEYHRDIIEAARFASNGIRPNARYMKHYVSGTTLWAGGVGETLLFPRMRYLEELEGEEWASEIAPTPEFECETETDLVPNYKM